MRQVVSREHGDCYRCCGSSVQPSESPPECGWTERVLLGKGPFCWELQSTWLIDAFLRANCNAGE